MSRAGNTAEVIHLHRGGADASDPDNKRIAPRRRVLKSAVAAYADRRCTIPCVVRDISDTGARVRATTSVGIPDTFELIIAMDGLEASCEVVWRKGEDIGVRFLGAPKKVEAQRHQSLNVIAPDRKPSLRRQPKPGP